MKQLKIFLSLSVTVLLLNGCIKEKYKIDYTDNTKRPIAEFLKGDSSAVTASIKSLALDFNSAFVDVDVTDIGTDLRNEFAGDIKIDIVKDDALLDAFNIANGTAFDPLPTTAGSLLSLSYTVSSTKKTVKVRARVKSSELLGQSYALALRISSASQGEISKMRKIYIVEVKVKNAFEGVYHATGVRTNYGGPTTAASITGTFPWDFEKDLFTVDASTCELLTADGVDIMFLKVNADNTVTISTHPFGSFATSNDGPCFYDPASKTFTLNYKYFNGVGNLRRMSETLVLQ